MVEWKLDRVLDGILLVLIEMKKGVGAQCLVQKTWGLHGFDHNMRGPNLKF